MPPSRRARCKDPSECATAATAGAASSARPAADVAQAPLPRDRPRGRERLRDRPRRRAPTRPAADAAHAGCATSRQLRSRLGAARSTTSTRSAGTTLAIDAACTILRRPPARADDEPRRHMRIVVTLQLLDDAARRAFDREPLAVCEPVPRNRIRALEPGNRHGRPPRRVSAAVGRDRSNVSSRSCASGDARRCVL